MGSLVSCRQRSHDEKHYSIRDFGWLVGSVAVAGEEL